MRALKQVLLELRRHANRVRAGLLLALIGQGLRVCSRYLPGPWPAVAALAGTVALGVALAMVWTGSDGFMQATVQGFGLSGGEEPSEPPGPS